MNPSKTCVKEVNGKRCCLANGPMGQSETNSNFVETNLILFFKACNFLSDGCPKRTCQMASGMLLLE